MLGQVKPCAHSESRRKDLKEDAEGSRQDDNEQQCVAKASSGTQVCNKTSRIEVCGGRKYPPESATLEV